MALLQKVKLYGNERLDLIDFNNVQDFTCADFKEIFKNVYSERSLIVSGFKLYQDSDLINEFPSTSPIYLEVANSTIIHSSSTTDPVFYIGPIGANSVEINLTNGATNYIELELIDVLEAPEARGFWDPTAENNLGKEFAQVVDTVKSADVAITVNTDGFTGGNKVPIAEIEVDNIGTIVALYDRRNLFFRLGQAQPFNSDYKYPFPNGRLEAVHQIVLESSEGYYLHTQNSPLQVWVINHNLGKKYVCCEFYDENNNRLTPVTITATNANTLTVDFGEAKVGRASILVGPNGFYFEYTNGAPSNSWVINHNLNTKYVNFQLYNTSDVAISATTVTATDNNTLTASFGGLTDGYAIVTIGSDEGRFQYVNGAASNNWVINHNLGFQYGNIRFYNALDVELIPDTIKALNPTTIQASFAGAEDGNAIFNADNGGTYLNGEVVVGSTSITQARVATPGTTSIEVYGKSDDKFIIGETLVGQQSGTARKIVSAKENFDSADKSIKNLKQMLDALMTEITKIKFGDDANRYWFEKATYSLKDINNNEEDTLEIGSAFLDGGGTITWNSGTGELSFTSDFTIPVIGTIYTNTISNSNSPLVLADDDVAYIDVNTGANASIAPTITTKALYTSIENRFIIARAVDGNAIIYDRLVS